MGRRVGGMIHVQLGGVGYQAKGDWEWNLGHPKRSAVVGTDGVHGYKEEPQPSYVEGKFTDRGDLDVSALVKMTDVTVTLELANGKVISLANAWYAADGKGSTAEGEVDARFESASPGEEVIT